MLEHGGRLRQAAARYGIPLADWLDLSTGINPNGWPVPPIPATAWSRLPEEEDGLEAAARAYYGTDSLLPVAGSQAAIRAVPRLRVPGRVGIIHPGYAEHAHAWRAAGHEVALVAPEALTAGPPPLGRGVGWNVLVLIHPNNPTGARFALPQLLDWHARLVARGGWLVVDEAFIDATPDHSLASHTAHPGLIVLRSLGKFFGLAGARVGFVLAEAEFLDRLRSLLGPWTVAAPSRWAARQALADSTWQQATRLRLPKAATRLARLLGDYGLSSSGSCALFQWVCTPRAAMIHEALARRSILTRLFADPPSLRFGLPGGERAWLRLEEALVDLCSTVDAEVAP
jgi:cobalamin biosynthetic protein CobC